MLQKDKDIIDPLIKALSTIRVPDGFLDQYEDPQTKDDILILTRIINELVEENEDLRYKKGKKNQGDSLSHVIFVIEHEKFRFYQEAAARRAKTMIKKKADKLIEEEVRRKAEEKKTKKKK